MTYEFSAHGRKLWHDIAVGLYYREQKDAGNSAYTWEQQNLATKLHYQKRAQEELMQFWEGSKP